MSMNGALGMIGGVFHTLYGLGFQRWTSLLRCKVRKYKLASLLPVPFVPLGRPYGETLTAALPSIPVAWMISPEIV